MRVQDRFHDLFEQPDCRGYFHRMRDVGYRNAGHLAPIVRAALAEVTRLRGERDPVVVEFAAGYGACAAMLRHDVTLAELLERYSKPEMRGITTLELGESDWDWYASRRRPEPSAHVIGLDVAGYALAYGHAVGAFDEIFREDLQDTPPSGPLARRLARAALIFEAGSVAHTAPETLANILACTGPRPPWFVMSPVRGTDRAAAARILERAGLRVEKVPVSPFVHRRFVDEAERREAIRQVRARGLDPAGLEVCAGSYFAEALVARPAGERTPIEGWLATAPASAPLGA